MVSNLDCEQPMNIDESQMWHIQNISVAAALSKVRSILIVWTCDWLVWKFLFTIYWNSSIDFAYWPAKPHWQVFENTKKPDRLKGRKAVTILIDFTQIKFCLVVLHWNYMKLYMDNILIVWIIYKLSLIGLLIKPSSHIQVTYVGVF